MSPDPQPKPVNLLIPGSLIDPCACFLQLPLELELGVSLFCGRLSCREPSCPPPLSLEPGLVQERDQLGTLGLPPLGVDIGRLRG